MKLLNIIILSILMLGCTTSPKEKYQKSRNNLVNVHDKIKELIIDDPLISGYSNMYIMDKYLIITDWRAHDKQIHLFDKKDFRHLTSTTRVGQGPNEIIHINAIIPDEKHGKFYAIDGGKRKLFSYDLDSLLADNNYSFTTKADLVWNYPANFTYVEDTFTIAQMADFNANGEGKLSAGIWNLSTGTYKKGYEHPSVEENIFQFAASPEANLYIICYSYYDLMTICDINGNLRCNIYGPKWKDKSRDFKYFSMGSCIGGDKVYALYSGKERNRRDNYPEQIIVFDTEGNYLKTLNVGYKLIGLCYDKDNYRLILNFDDDIQFGYLDLEGII